MTEPAATDDDDSGTMSIRSWNIVHGLCAEHGLAEERESVAQFTERQMLRLPNCGPVSLAEIKAWLGEKGLTFSVVPGPALRPQTPQTPRDGRSCRLSPAVLLNIVGILADLSAIQRRIMAVQDAPMRATVQFETMPDGNALAFALRVEIDLGQHDEPAVQLQE